jgi:uncharacterized membrane protein YkoI
LPALIQAAFSGFGLPVLRMNKISLLAGALLVLAFVETAAAQPRWRDPDLRGQLSPEDARDGVERGDLRPVREILAAVQARFPGRNLGQSLIPGNPPVYEVDWLTNDGRKLAVIVNARTASILSVRGD